MIEFNQDEIEVVLEVKMSAILTCGLYGTALTREVIADLLVDHLANMNIDYIANHLIDSANIIELRLDDGTPLYHEGFVKETPA